MNIETNSNNSTNNIKDNNNSNIGNDESNSTNNIGNISNLIHENKSNINELNYDYENKFDSRKIENINTNIFNNVSFNQLNPKEEDIISYYIT